MRGNSLPIFGNKKRNKNILLCNLQGFKDLENPFQTTLQKMYCFKFYTWDGTGASN